MLRGKILRSPYPHARILHIDTRRALRLPGVKAVVTGRDTLGVRFGVLATVAKLMDRQPLAVDRVRYIGDEVAAVAAVDEETAEEACSLIQVEYEPLPAVLDPLRAMEAGVPQLHDHAPNNISKRHVFECGDVEGGFREAFHVREDRFSTQAVTHAPLEPHTCLAQYDSCGKLTLWTSTQSPYFVQQDLAKTLGLPANRVRVIKPCVGGGFGGKSDGMDALDFCAALLSMRTGHPVRMAYSREEELLITRRRHPMFIELRTGVRKDGTLVARQCRAILDGGAYNSWGPTTTILCCNWNFLPYRLTNYRYEGLRVYTNKPPGGAMRGHGAPQIHFAVESQLDMLAADLGMDPLELRLRNALETGDANPNGFQIVSSAFRDCLLKAAEAAGWKEKWGKLPPNRGIGIGCSGFVCGAAFPVRPTPAALSAANIRLSEGGKATLFTGAVDTGQGADTVLAQIAARTLGIPVEDVEVVSADTELTPIDMGNYSSRTTMLAGNAVKNAALDLRRKMLEAVAERLEARPQDLAVEGGRIFVRGSPARSISFAEGVEVAYRARGGQALMGEGAYNPPPGRISSSFSFTVQVAEVEVEPDTGQTRLLGLTAAHDCGMAINPIAVEGQLQGSVNMGLGYVLAEDLPSEAGQTLASSFLDYRLPTAAETPSVLTVDVEQPDPEGPLGAKEAGEGTVGPTAPAIANAIFHATGARIRKLPMTPEVVGEALAKLKDGSRKSRGGRR
jgi:4-hydroxybenzoyl-CoA reductase subunit alpha